MQERMRISGVGFGIFLSGMAWAQNAPPAQTDVYTPPPPAADNPASAQPTFSKEQIAQIVAPLALYPDSLLTQVLMASTYPLEVVQADRFAKANQTLKGDELAKQLEQQPWDPSVKSLMNFPQVLAMMSDQLDTTVQLGNAFLAQQQDVLAAVQDLRGRARQAGTLRSSEQVNVTSQPSDASNTFSTSGAADNQPDIYIAPTADNLSYVPDYDPTTIYGAWPYPNYQPYSYYPAGYGVGGLAWGSGIVYGSPWGYAWGNPNWHRRWIDYDFHRNERWNSYINRDQYHDRWEHYRETRNFGDDHWTHDARHRDGVPYPDARDSERFRQRTVRDEQDRDAFRGREYGQGNDSLGIRGDNRGSEVRRDDDRVVTIKRGRPQDNSASMPDGRGIRVDNRNDDRSEVIRRDQQSTADRRQAEADAERRAYRSGDPQPIDRSNLGDINRTQAEERSAAERGRASRNPSAAPLPQNRAESPAIRSTPAPVRSDPSPVRGDPSPSPVRGDPSPSPVRSYPSPVRGDPSPSPVRSVPSPAPSNPRIASPSPSPRAASPAPAPSVGARNGGSAGNGRR